MRAKYCYCWHCDELADPYGDCPRCGWYQRICMAELSPMSKETVVASNEQLRRLKRNDKRIAIGGIIFAMFLVGVSAYLTFVTYS